MAEATPPTNDFVDVVLGLPPQLQGIVLLGAGIVGGWFVWQRFLRGYMAPPQDEPKGELLISDSATIADMKPIRDLIAQMDLLTVQLMRNEVSNSSLLSGIADTTKKMLDTRIAAGIEHEKSQRELMQSLRELADLLAQHLVDLRQEREDREDKERLHEALEEGRRLGREQARAEVGRTRKRSTPKKEEP